MGLFGSATSRSGSAQKWAKPFAKQAAGQVQSVFSQAQPQLEQITQGVTSLLPQVSQQFQGWSPATSQAQGYYGDVLSGKYLDPSNNTALQGVLDRTRRDVIGDVNSQFSMAGRYGSGAHTDILSRNLAEAESGILADQYNRERAAMDAAAGTVPQLQGSTLAQLLQGSQVGAELPYTGTNSLANSLAALFSGGKTKGPGMGAQLLSGAGQAASAFASMGGR